MSEYEVKQMVADLMIELDEAGRGTPDNEAYAAALRWMNTGDSRPVYNMYARISQHRNYRIRADGLDEAILEAQKLASDEFDLNEWAIEIDEAEDDAPGFDDIEINDA